MSRFLCYEGKFLKGQMVLRSRLTFSMNTCQLSVIGVVVWVMGEMSALLVVGRVM
jgi:hypothetical protein